MRRTPGESGPPRNLCGLRNTASYPSLSPDLMSISTYGPLNKQAKPLSSFQICQHTNSSTTRNYWMILHMCRMKIVQYYKHVVVSHYVIIPHSQNSIYTSTLRQNQSMQRLCTDEEAEQLHVYLSRFP